MDEYDLEQYRYLTGACVGIFPLFCALVGWYLPRWRHEFFTTYRVKNSARRKNWYRWVGIGAFLQALELLFVFLVYLELVAGESLLSGDFFTGLRVGLCVSVMFAWLVVVVLVAVRKVVMAVRGATPYDRQSPQGEVSLGETQHWAKKEIAALEARLANAGPAEPGRERAAEYLEVAQRLFAFVRVNQSVFLRDVPRTGAIDAVVAAVLCRVARSALEKGEPVAEEKALCLFNPLHEPAHGTHEMDLGLPDGPDAYPLCQGCLLDVRTASEFELLHRNLMVPLGTGHGHQYFLHTILMLLYGDTRPREFFKLAKEALHLAETDIRH